ncbi:MAG TPA: hypothetical protein VGI64_11255 [Streptosporangiaceae bacterium]|jgi:hypothetical protein
MFGPHLTAVLAAERQQSFLSRAQADRLASQARRADSPQRGDEARRTVRQTSKMRPAGRSRVGQPG